MPTQKTTKLNIHGRHSKKKRVVKTKKYSLKNGRITLTGGMGSSEAKYWKENPYFKEINKENERRLILSKSYNSENSQYEQYRQMLKNFLSYDSEKYMINMDFTNMFYRNIFYDVDGNYNIDLTKQDKPEWSTPDNSRYKIDKVLGGLAHQNTTILFLSNKQIPEDKKAIKIFNLYDVNINKINDYLSVEITKIGGKNRTMFGQKNYIYYPDLDNFNKLNFNDKLYYSDEISGLKTQFVDIKSKMEILESDIKVYLSCRNIDPVNDFINNLIIKHVADQNPDKIRVIDYNNLFVTKVKTPKSESYKYCLIMDRVDGSLDQYFIDLVNKNLETKYEAPFSSAEPELIKHSDRLYNYLLQTENMLRILKHPDYLFTHTDMKLENLFYKLNKDKDGNLDIYLGDFDKSSITLNGMRFYNNILKNPNNKALKADLVQSFYGNLLVDEYTTKQYEERKDIIKDGTGIQNYRLSRIGRKQIDFAEPEQLYMRYNNQPYYTSFDMISLLLSILHFRIGDTKQSLIDFDNKSDENLSNIYVKLGYMTSDTLPTLYEIYSKLKENYNGNFGKLMNSILIVTDALLMHINFIHNYDAIQPTKLDFVYLTLNNKLGLSIPIVPTSIKQSGNITQFAVNIDKTKSFYTDQNIRDKKISEFTTKFIDYIVKLNKKHNLDLLNIEYSGDYSIKKEMGSLTAALMHLPPPVYCIRTNKYSNNHIIYEWDYFVNISDFDNYCKMLMNINLRTRDDELAVQSDSNSGP